MFQWAVLPLCQIGETALWTVHLCLIFYGPTRLSSWKTLEQN